MKGRIISFFAWLSITTAIMLNTYRVQDDNVIFWLMILLNSVVSGLLGYLGARVDNEQ